MTKRTLILCILSEKYNRLWNHFLYLHLLLGLEENRVNFVGLPIKICALDTSRVKISRDKSPTNIRMLQDTFAIIKADLLARVGAEN